MCHLALTKLRFRAHSVYAVLASVAAATAIAGCDGWVSARSVDRKLIPGVKVEARVVGSEDLRTSVLSPSLPTQDPSGGQAVGQYVVLSVRNTTDLGVWGSIEVALGDDRTYDFRVPHLEPLQQVPVVFVAYVGSGWSSPGAREYKWAELHGK